MTSALRSTAVVAVLAGMFGLAGARDAEAAWHRPHHRRHHRPVHVYSARPTYYVYSPQPVYVYNPPTVQYVTPSYTYVAPPVTYYNPYSDQAVHAAVVNMLVARFPGQIRKLKIEVKRGEVEIDGNVYSKYMKYAIQQAIYQIPGVRKVDNDLHVKR